MEELIKEAEELYKNIDVTQSHLIKARLDKDRIREHLELIGLETIVFDVKQLLKCIIERKGNIVDLGEVWHDITEPADRNGHVLLSNHPKYIEMASQGQKIWGENICKRAKYAYLKDLLPKGGEA